MLTNTTVLVTGAGSGIGLATARALASEGVSVIACDLAFTEDSAGPLISTVEVDVTAQKELWAALGPVADRLPPLTGAVCAAGIQYRHSSIDLDEKAWRRVLSVHLDGSMFTSQFAASRMSAGGSIVLFSSVAEQFGHPERAPYSAAKAGISALGRSLAVEWAREGIRVNSVELGYVDTPMISAARERGELPEGVEERHALGRIAHVREVVEPVLFLLGPGSSFITGATLAVDGGFSIYKGW